jgi:hypothetical protein
MCLPCEFFNRKKSLYKFNPFFMPFLDRKKNFERETLNQLGKKPVEDYPFHGSSKVIFVLFLWLLLTCRGRL